MEEAPGISDKFTHLGIDHLVGEAWLEKDHGKTSAVEMTDEVIIDYVQGHDVSEHEVEESRSMPSSVSHTLAEATFSMSDLAGTTN